MQVRDKEGANAQKQKCHADFALQASRVSKTLVKDDRYISV